ncbi:hypothetical protein [Thermomonospora umbrina]|uniref:Uncharacterized protein n=1 Tax=Thermomonospora umbrina TaxID=111806 RepID=A0A3D9SV51_9ACTN|nr:hypothetical protein [Thermomonospora umbrina]REE96885.1 hypothetical protein DFJ69_2338 [Thermomonospora umbrina]
MSRYQRDPAPCPVCFVPQDPGPSCAECGWLPPPPGTPTAAYEQRLHAAQRLFDAVAAARISPVDGRHLPYIRGERPSEDEWAVARRLAAVDTEAAEEFRARVEAVLAALPDQGRLTLIEAGDEGITLTLAGLDRFGMPRSRRWPVLPWTTLVPMLAAESPGEFRFRLAGGLGGVDRSRLWEELDRNLAAMVRVPAGHRVELICTAPGWPVPERALISLRPRGMPAAPARLSGVDVETVVGDAVAALPLRAKLELIVVELDPATGRVLPRSAPLFAAGDPVGTERGMTVRCVHPHEDGTVFAVATWRDDGPRVLSIGSARLPPGRHRVRAVLEGAGQVKFVEPEGVAPDHRRWSELMQALPTRLVPEITAVDVVCLIDQSGTGLEARRRLAADFVALLRDSFPEQGRARVAVLGYGRHDFRLEGENADVVQGEWLAPPAAALDTLARLESVRTDQIAAAPVEDALFLAAKGIGRIDRGRRVMLLILGDRPPHPARDGPDGLLPCPREHDWQSLLRRIEDRPGLSRVVVLDSAEHLTTAWRRLGRTALLRLERTDARKLATAAEIVPPESGRLAFPLPDHDE